MNDNILCLYYSRTGNTKKAMEEVAEALGCECLEIRDKIDRGGCINTLTAYKPSPYAKANPSHTNLVEVVKA